jgi:hypothetical protein
VSAHVIEIVCSTIELAAMTFAVEEFHRMFDSKKPGRGAARLSAATSALPFFLTLVLSSIRCRNKSDTFQAVAVAVGAFTAQEGRRLSLPTVSTGTACARWRR